MKMLDFLSLNKDVDFSFMTLNKNHIAIELLEQSLNLSYQI